MLLLPAKLLFTPLLVPLSFFFFLFTSSFSLLCPLTRPTQPFGFLVLLSFFISPMASFLPSPLFHFFLPWSLSIGRQFLAMAPPCHHQRLCRPHVPASGLRWPTPPLGSPLRCAWPAQPASLTPHWPKLGSAPVVPTPPAPLPLRPHAAWPGPTAARLPCVGPPLARLRYSPFPASSARSLTHAVLGYFPPISLFC